MSARQIFEDLWFAACMALLGGAGAFKLSNSKGIAWAVGTMLFLGRAIAMVFSD